MSFWSLLIEKLRLNGQRVAEEGVHRCVCDASFHNKQGSESVGSAIHSYTSVHALLDEKTFSLPGLRVN